MKALSLTQPWASLLSVGAKRIETRGWSSSYRGPLAIHAAKGFPPDARDFASASFVRQYLKDLPLTLPLGAVVATCVLLDCVPTESLKWIPEDLPTDCQARHWPPGFEFNDPGHEYLFGNYDPKRFAWLLGSIKMLPEPIPARGALSLWEWNEK